LKQIKRSKLFVIISAVIIFLIFICSAFSISISEFKHKISCIKKMSDIYKEVSVQNVFESINKEISDCADNNSTNHYEILLPDGKELAENEILQENTSFICTEYQFLRNPIYLIVYDSKNIYYVFEESEYIIVFSEYDTPDITLINSKDKFFKYKLDNHVYMYIKLQYYD